MICREAGIFLIFQFPTICVKYKFPLGVFRRKLPSGTNMLETEEKVMDKPMIGKNAENVLEGPGERQINC
jgi:hypothetical protein